MAERHPDPQEEVPVCYLGHEHCYDLHTAERLADEADWEIEKVGSMPEYYYLVCPKCGKGPLLTYASILVAVLHANGTCGRSYGRPSIVRLSSRADVFCNLLSCGWQGTLREARLAAGLPVSDGIDPTVENEIQ